MKCGVHVLLLLVYLVNNTNNNSKMKNLMMSQFDKELKKLLYMPKVVVGLRIFLHIYV